VGEKNGDSKNTNGEGLSIRGAIVAGKAANWGLPDRRPGEQELVEVLKIENHP